MKNYLKIYFEALFPKEKVDKEKVYKILKSRNFFDRKNDIFSILPYSNKLISKSIKDFKFRNKISNADFFGEILFENTLDYIENLKIKENFNNPILITVPISFWRKIKRGYNQNDLIISKFMKLGGNNFIFWEKNNLIKIKHTKPQSLMSNKTERLKNQKNAFKLKNIEKIKGKNIILFDDIYTTGATINEIKKLLYKKGAKDIKIIVLAH